MKILLRHFFRIIVAFTCFSASTAISTPLPSSHDMQLIDLINDARSAPLVMAQKYGLNAGTILARYPEMKEALVKGLPPLHFNQALYDTAMKHTQDMLEKKYYSKTSPDGQDVADRIESSRYMEPSITGENLGMLGFINFIEPDVAIEQIFKKMFLEELETGESNNWNILNPEMEDIGVSINSGRWTVNSVVYNIYMTTCDFSASWITKTELQLLAGINQARTSPVEVALASGIDTDVMAKDLENHADSIQHGIPPVAPNDLLYLTAEEHATDMLERRYFSSISPEGKTLEYRMMLNGYASENSDEVLGSQISDGTETEIQIAKSLLVKRLREEFVSDLPDTSRILNPEFQEVGVRLLTEPFLNKDQTEQYQYQLMVLDFASSAKVKKPLLMVYGYVDNNENGLFDIGEGTDGLRFEIEDTDGNSLSVATGKSGYTEFELDPGEYRIKFSERDDADTNADSYEIEIEDRNVAVWLRKAGNGLQ